MKIVCHMPADNADAEALKIKVAKIHSEKVIGYLRDLSTASESKSMLAELIISSWQNDNSADL